MSQTVQVRMQMYSTLYLLTLALLTCACLVYVNPVSVADGQRNGSDESSKRMNREIEDADTLDEILSTAEKLSADQSPVGSMEEQFAVGKDAKMVIAPTG
ncbi:unnamed protein product [Calicophoron daubneyi]|uniref:Uncharacterized protein n=1 Tax=Calicophoron daubneyi TaxID=300641 RepID=A0AAV2TIB2_CALDB